MPDQKANNLAAKLPFLLILLAAGIGAFVVRNHVNFETLANNRDSLIAFRDQNYTLAVAAFILIYICIVTFSLPVSTLVSLTGGFLFGLFPGVLYVITAATVGATLNFLAAKRGFGAQFSARMSERGGGAARLQAALQENEWSALFIMRFAPVVPFFLANLIPAFVGVRTSRFVISTFFGIMPGALILTSVGVGLDSVFANREMPDLSILYSPRILLPILGLVALSALPIVIKYRRKKVP